MFCLERASAPRAPRARLDVAAEVLAEEGVARAVLELQDQAVGQPRHHHALQRDLSRQNEIGLRGPFLFD